MKNRLLFVALILVANLPRFAFTHDVPDRVQVTLYLSPEAGRMVVLARVPANALIDYLLPTLPESNWVDLQNAEPVATEAARVWIADRLALSENGTPLQKPRLLAVRLSRINDPAFRSFADAMEHVKGDRLSTDVLARQDELTVDALLETPIRSARSDFEITPRFGRLGVLVYTTLGFFPDGGGARQFLYEGDPPVFHLDAAGTQAFADFFASGFWRFIADRQSLLLIACVALAFRGARKVLPFMLFMITSQTLGITALFASDFSATWFPAICQALVAAATVYLGSEAIVATAAPGSERLSTAVFVGAVLSCVLWSMMRHDLQFGGSHTLVATCGFLLGVVASQALMLTLAAGLLNLLLQFSMAPQATTMIAAAVAIHVSWRAMLDQVQTIPLFASPDLPRQIFPFIMSALILLAATTLITSKIRERSDDANNNSNKF